MRKAVKKSEKLARQVQCRQDRLGPKLPDIEPHDLHLILWSLLQSKYGWRRAGGGYVC